MDYEKSPMHNAKIIFGFENEEKKHLKMFYILFLHEQILHF